MVITHCSVPTVVRKTLSQYALLSRVDREPMCPDGGRSKHGDSPSEERTFMRLKIIAGNLVAVLLLGLISFFVVRSQLTSGLEARVDTTIANDAEVIERSWRLSGIEFTSLVSDRAATREARDVFAALDEDQRRTRGYEAAERLGAWFGDQSRRGVVPDIILFTDETGKVLARNADRNRMYGAILTTQIPALRAVLEHGTELTDVWRKDDEGKVMQVAAAPIRSEAGSVIGTLVVGYDVSNGYATGEARLLSRDVAFVSDQRVYSSSLPTDRAEALKAFLFSEAQRGATVQALGGGADPQPFRTTLGGDEYIGALGRLANTTSAPLAFVVLGNRTTASALASSTNIVLILTVLFALVVLGYGFAIGTQLLRPIEQIEEGLLAVVNGRTDLRLDVQSAELGGLAYRINQLLNVFTGVQETTEDDAGRVSSPPDQAAWKDQAFSEGAAAGGGGAAEPIDDPELGARLEAEPEDAYLARVFQEYVSAKQAAGENLAIPQDKFAQRMKGQAEALAKKHACRMVRFQVQARGAEVVLRPVLIR